MNLFEHKMREVYYKVVSYEKKPNGRCCNFDHELHCDNDIQRALGKAILIQESDPDMESFIWVFDKETGIAVYDIIVKKK